RLYLFQNSPQGLTLLADYYISVGKLGTSKAVEGDQRTPLGVYYMPLPRHDHHAHRRRNE
ncbi:MAG: hypothetical protein ACKO26_19465, partial [Planctomycetota bacterium]